MKEREVNQNSTVKLTEPRPNMEPQVHRNTSRSKKKRKKKCILTEKQTRLHYCQSAGTVFEDGGQVVPSAGRGHLLKVILMIIITIIITIEICIARQKKSAQRVLQQQCINIVMN